MIKTVIKLDKGLYLHNNPVNKTISDPLQTTTDLSKAKMWEKPGMASTWADKHYHRAMLERDGHTMCQFVSVKCTYEEIEND